jgi:hypothetical protein
LISLTFFYFFALRIGNIEANSPRRAPAAATDDDGGAQWVCGWRAAMRPHATWVDYNVKEQVIRSRIKRSSQRAVSRETRH